jgi:hypothetical protein
MRTTDIVETRTRQGGHRKLITLSGAVALAGAMFLSPALIPQASASPLPASEAGSLSAPAQVSNYHSTWPPGSWEYRQGYRNGYRDGSRDGWAEGKRDCKSERRHSSRIQSAPGSDYDRGYAEGYDRGFELGFDRAIRQFCR